MNPLYRGDAMLSPTIGQFYDLAIILHQPWMADVVTAVELRKWPLMRGTLPDAVELEEIRIGGLTAPTGQNKAVNSSVYDEALS
jgi:hypothetical protein